MIKDDLGPKGGGIRFTPAKLPLPQIGARKNDIEVKQILSNERGEPIISWQGTNSHGVCILSHWYGL